MSHPTDNSFVLILDDYHNINDLAIHKLMTYLLDYLPQSLRLLIATRHDPPLPLPRLRGQGQLAEIRLPELRFDQEEATVFLNQRHQLSLPAVEVTALHKYTGGWAAGLQLLAAVLATLPTSDERSNYVQQHAPANRSIFDLLAAEVLAHQPPDLQEFLLQTSVLTELTPSNCQSVTNNPDAARLLTEVYQRNLFLKPLTHDTLAGPFHYHDLFGSFLQEKLKREHPQQWTELHRRAEDTADNEEQKLRYLIRAEMWEEAAHLLHKMVQLDTDRRFTRSSVVQGIESLPAGVRKNHPWLLLFVGQHYAVRGQKETAAPWLAQAADRFREEGDDPGEIEILAARAMTDALNTAEIVSAFRQKIATSGHLLQPNHWSVYHGAEMWHAVAIQDWPTLNTHLQASIPRALQSGDPGSVTMTLLTIGPQMLFADEGMALVEKFAADSLKAAGPNDWILQICANGLLGAVLFFQNRIEESDEAARKAYDLLQEVGGLGWIDDHISWLILSTALARRAYYHFDEFLAAQTVRWSTQDTAASYRQGYLYLHGRALWLRRRTSEAQEVLKQMQAIVNPSGYEMEDEICQLLLSGLISMAKEDTGPAEQYFRRAVSLHERVRHTILLTHPRLGLATLFARQNRWQEAMSEFSIILGEIGLRGMPGIILQEGESILPLLSYAIEQGIEREMLQHLRQMLHPSSAPKPIPLPNTHAYLTPREGEVLHLLASGATNPAIAAELSITERTVKAHMTRILAKLNAANRTEAVTKASRLGLL